MKLKVIGMLVIVVGLIALVAGAVFVQQGFSKESYLVNAMTQEQIKFEGVEGVVDSAEDAQLAGDTVREHRHGIAPTYGDLLGGGRFDATNPQQLTYAQALNLENYLYLAVASFGVFTVVKAVGALMIILGIGFKMNQVTTLIPSAKMPLLPSKRFSVPPVISWASPWEASSGCAWRFVAPPYSSPSCSWRPQPTRNRKKT